MRPIAKPILSAGAFLAALLLAVTLLFNAWLQLPGTRERILTVLGHACGEDIAFRGLYGLPWGEIRISGITMGPKDSRFRFKADAVRIRISSADLLTGKISVVSCSLDHPCLSLAVEAAPVPPHEKSTFLIPGKEIAGSIPLTIPAAPSPSASAVPPPSVFSPQCNLSLRNGEFRLTDSSARPIVIFTGVNLAGYGTSGHLTATKAIVGNTFIFRNIEGSLDATNDSLALRNLRAVIGEGTITGSLDYLDAFTLRPQYRLTLELQGADLNRLLADAAYPSTSAKGTVSGTLSLQGLAGRGTTMQGEGTLLLQEASFQPADFLRQIGRILSIEELQLLRLSEGRCLFRVESGELRVEDLLLRSDNLMLAATGPVNHNGNLDLQTRLLFNEKLTSRLRGMIGSQLAPAPEPGYTQVAFRVTGPALNPKTDLLERLTGIRIGGDLGGLGNLLQGLFGKPAPAQSPH